MYPTMTYRNYIRKFAAETKNGMFFCKLCNSWINKHRWVHFKYSHRYKKATPTELENLNKNKNTQSQTKLDV